MSDEEWAKLFELIGKVVNMEGRTWQEKAAKLKDQAEKSDNLGNLDEFANYIQSE